MENTSREAPKRAYWWGGRKSLFALWTFHLGDYMHRFNITLPGGYTIRFHHILRSDRGPHLHNHPFSFYALLLTGGYWEVIPDPVPGNPTATRCVWRRWLSFRWVDKATMHQVIVHKPVWTLCFATPSDGNWGFFVGGFDPKNFVHHDDYDYTNEWGAR